MLKEAEDFAEEDKLAKERIDAKNSLESYIYSIKNQMDDEVPLDYYCRKN
jgi:heat shock protein 5